MITLHCYRLVSELLKDLLTTTQSVDKFAGVAQKN